MQCELRQFKSLFGVVTATRFEIAVRSRNVISSCSYRKVLICMYTESRWFAQAVGLLVLQKFSVPSNNSYQPFLMLERCA